VTELEKDMETKEPGNSRNENWGKQKGKRIRRSRFRGVHVKCEEGSGWTQSGKALKADGLLTLGDRERKKRPSVVGKKTGVRGAEKHNKNLKRQTS